MIKPIIFFLLFLINLNIFSFENIQSDIINIYKSAKNEENIGNYYKAIELYKKALEKNPVYVDPIIGLALSYFYLNEYDESIIYSVEAQKYDKKNNYLRVLEARSRIAIGDLKEAEIILSSVLRIEINNIEAKLGLAELDIARGELKKASSKYLEILKASPFNRRALLSLSVLYDNYGNNKDAENIIIKALKYHSDDPNVRYLAANHFYINGKMKDAEKNILKAININNNDLDSILLLSKIYLNTNRYDDVIPLLKKIVKIKRDNYLIWYTAGIANLKLSDKTKAIKSLEETLNLRPDDEISRLAIEQILINGSMENTIRDKYSNYHLEKGKGFEDRNIFDKALDEFQRALTLSPYSKEARIKYANIFLKKGYPDKYLSELKFLIDQGYADEDISDEIEIRESMIESGVAAEWAIEQFYVNKNKYNLHLFYNKNNGSLKHFDGEIFLSNYLKNTFNRFDSINILSDCVVNDSFSESFSFSRKNNSDYFLIFDFIEYERVFSINCKIYSSKTGTFIDEINVIRTGNNKITNSISKIVLEIKNRFPIWGKIIKRNFNRVALNLGSIDGIKKDDKLLIIKSEKVKISNNLLDLDYNNSDVLGELVIKKIDEMISEGEIKQKSFFDLVNINDEIILRNTEKKVIENNSIYSLELYRNILKIK